MQPFSKVANFFDFDVFHGGRAADRCHGDEAVDHRVDGFRRLWRGQLRDRGFPRVTNGLFVGFLCNLRPQELVAVARHGSDETRLS
jgi:hypothetical protein